MGKLRIKKKEIIKEIEKNEKANKIKEFLKTKSRRELWESTKRTKKYIKFWNSLCSRCKKKAYKNPTMGISEYCEDCQKKYWEIMGGEPNKK